MDVLERPAFRHRPGPRRDLLLLCDHASATIPDEYRNLGLPDAALRKHLVWDAGAAAVTEAMAEQLACPAFFGGASRLLADLNRTPDAPDLIVEDTDGIVVPGNTGLTALQRQERLVRWHQPYHHAVSRHLDLCQREGEHPAIVSIHSFTPVYQGQSRPWPIGLLWKHREAWLDGLFAHLRAQGLAVGDNQPYDGSVLLGHTLERHALARGLRHVLIELRQDEVASAAQQQAWAERLVGALAAVQFLNLEPRRPAAAGR